MRARPDLTARRHRYQGRSYWVVKEPVGLNYFRFQEEEYYILQQLDGRTSLDEIKRRFEAQFPPQKITVEELQQIVAFYESPTGQKLASANMEVNSDLQAVLQVFTNNTRSEFFAKVRAELRAKGFEV